MKIILETERLKVEVAAPGESPNTTTRFDRAGFVTQVTLDNKYEFCTREPDNLSHPCTGGIGLCSEFKLQKPAQEAPLGAQFPKLGIGLLTKDLEGGYVHHHKYKYEPYDISFESTQTSVTFITEPNPCMGYAARQIKKLEVQGNQLTMTMSVENVGAESLDFTEYCHNFISIEHLPIGDNYHLGMSIASQDEKAPKRGDALVGNGNGFTFKHYSNSPSMMIVNEEEINDDTPFIWKLTHKKSPAWISEEVSNKPAFVALWTIDHIISPEVMCSFEISPGQKATWTRKWTFGC